MKNQTRSFLLIGFLAVGDLLLWSQILFVSPVRASFTMLDVGQGDGSLIQLLDGAVVMTDAGPSRATTRSLDKIALPSSRYIDLAVITHPQLDHYGGFVDLLDHYDFGAFLVTGRVPDDNSLVWQALIQKLKEKHIPVIFVGRGDQIVQKDSLIKILSPDKIFRESGELNDTGIVEYVKMASTSVLLTADIGKDVEDYLIAHDQIHADILKVAHHGSRYSSSAEFLNAVHPKIAVIGVGENHYGHPAKETLEHLKSFVGDRIFRTDKDGNVSIVVDQGKLQVFTEK